MRLPEDMFGRLQAAHPNIAVSQAIRSILDAYLRKVESLRREPDVIEIDEDIIL
jgi:hypothetical protein